MLRFAVVTFVVCALTANAQNADLALRNGKIVTLDETTELLHYPYLIERGKRLRVEPVPVGGF